MLACVSSEQKRGDSFRDRKEELRKRPLYQLVFLGDDENQSVEVEEVEEIDFAELRTRLEEGESVFITKKENEKIELIDLDKEYETKDARKSWYVAHI